MQDRVELSLPVLVQRVRTASCTTPIVSGKKRRFLKKTHGRHRNNMVKAQGKRHIPAVGKHTKYIRCTALKIVVGLVQFLSASVLVQLSRSLPWSELNDPNQPKKYGKQKSQFTLSTKGSQLRHHA